MRPNPWLSHHIYFFLVEYQKGWLFHTVPMRLLLEIGCTAVSFSLFSVNVFYLCKVKDLALKAASVHHGRALYAISKEFPALLF